MEIRFSYIRHTFLFIGVKAIFYVVVFCFPICCFVVCIKNIFTAFEASLCFVLVCVHTSLAMFDFVEKACRACSLASTKTIRSVSIFTFGRNFFCLVWVGLFCVSRYVDNLIALWLLGLLPWLTMFWFFFLSVGICVASRSVFSVHVCSLGAISAWYEARMDWHYYNYYYY